MDTQEYFYSLLDSVQLELEHNNIADAVLAIVDCLPDAPNESHGGIPGETAIAETRKFLCALPQERQSKIATYVRTCIRKTIVADAWGAYCGKHSISLQDAVDVLELLGVKYDEPMYVSPVLDFSDEEPTIEGWLISMGKRVLYGTREDPIGKFAEAMSIAHALTYNGQRVIV